jgi:hypothetical protein
MPDALIAKQKVKFRLTAELSTTGVYHGNVFILSREYCRDYNEGHSLEVQS